LFLFCFDFFVFVFVFLLLIERTNKERDKKIEKNICIIERHNHKTWNKLTKIFIVLIIVQHYQCSRKGEYVQCFEIKCLLYSEFLFNLQNIVTFMGYSKQKQTQKTTTTKKQKQKQKNQNKTYAIVIYLSEFYSI
jgi:hypothetical protein